MFNRNSLSRMLSLGLLATVGCSSVASPAANLPPSSATAGDSTIVAISPPGHSCSIFDLLGVKQAAACTHVVRDCIAARLGMLFPGLEPTPALKLIADPANLDENAPPTVQAAAEIKQKEDQAAQKIKGIRYLATIGCGGCYAGVEEALLQSLEDCTEAVRYETALALRKTVGRECSFCSEKACCSAKVQKKLYEMLDNDLNGCYNEPSERVRRQARLALRACGPVVPAVEEADEENGDENGESVIEGPKDEDEPAVPEDVQEGADGDPNELLPAPPQADITSRFDSISLQAAFPNDNGQIPW